MTPQEIKYQNRRVRVVNYFLSSGRIHYNSFKNMNLCGTVVRDAKNGMLLIAFCRRRGEYLVSIPASCVEIIR